MSTIGFTDDFQIPKIQGETKVYRIFNFAQSCDSMMAAGLYQNTSFC